MSDEIIFSTYVKYMYEYLLKNTNIREVDNLFEICFEFDFPTISEEYMDNYQKLASEYLKYFYVRNDININNLTDEEKAFIAKRIQEGRLNYDDEINLFIERTLPKVILLSNEKLGDHFLVNYGPASAEYYLVPNTSLVIGFRYSEYVDYDLSEYENQQRYMNREKFTEEQCTKLGQKMSNDLKIKVRVLEYGQDDLNYNDRTTFRSRI